ncbi:MAG: glycosyltransferase family 9 protein [Deferribacteraceae bacterium]|jgi:ADP-heptose:LPS heptosyltransferase|nr:glycosyltransferase family 9 protein [Deferribacteraceae bacterium]
MRLLFIRFSSLGDVILSTGILKHLHEALPDATIDVLSFSAFADVYRLCPAVSQVHTVDKGVPLSQYRAFLSSLPAYDFIFDLHDNPRSGVARKALQGKAFVYKKSGIARRLYVWLRLCKQQLNKHVVLRYAEAVFPALGLPLPLFEELRPAIANASIPQPKKLILHPFASKFTKTWPHFPELATRLVQEGWQVKLIGKGDFPAIAGVERVDTPTIADMFRYMADAELVVSTDSGPMHAAIALNVPLVAVFGSTTKELGFYPSFAHCKVVERDDVPCRPCHVHGRSSCPKKHFDCMIKIAVDDVMAAIE